MIGAQSCSRSSYRAFADTGASGTYLTTSAPIIPVPTTSPPIHVGVPNGTYLQSSAQCKLDFPMLPEEAQQAHILPGLTMGSLLSIGRLCDAGCIATFDQHKVNIFKDDTLLLSGSRDPATKLWSIPLTSPTFEESISNAHQTTTTKELVRFLHAADFSPSKSTFIDAVSKGYFNSWSGLNTKAITKYLSNEIATSKGHLDQARRNQRPTEHTNFSPVSDNPNIPTNQLFATIELAGKIYTDQTGRFPITSSRGSKYIFILYSYDTNAIFAHSLKSNASAQILDAYKKTYQLLHERGFKPQVHWLDNEASTALKEFNKKNNIEYQLVPPHAHRRNAAERAIRTWKNHFIAGLCSVDPTFPMHL